MGEHLGFEIRTEDLSLTCRMTLADFCLFSGFHVLSTYKEFVMVPIGQAAMYLREKVAELLEPSEAL